MKRRTPVPVVDDDPRLVRFVSVGLVAHGYEVLTAAEGEEALSILRTQTPHVVLLDIILPALSRNRKMDGFDVLAEVRSFLSEPVIAISATIWGGEECQDAEV
jgi:two-component system, OmpR family, KDP operon response regulator KdpE